MQGFFYALLPRKFTRLYRVCCYRTLFFVFKSFPVASSKGCMLYNVHSDYITTICCIVSPDGDAGDMKLFNYSLRLAGGIFS